MSDHRLSFRTSPCLSAICSPFVSECSRHVCGSQRSCHRSSPVSAADTVANSVNSLSSEWVTAMDSPSQGGLPASPGSSRGGAEPGAEEETEDPVRGPRGTTCQHQPAARPAADPHTPHPVQMFVIKNLDTGTQMRIDDFDRLAHIATDPDPAAQVGGPKAQPSAAAAAAPCTPSTFSQSRVPPSSANNGCCTMCCPHVQEAHPAHKKGGLMKGTKALKHW